MADQGPSKDDDLFDECDHEFTQYEDERKQLRKTELEAEKTYGTLLVSLSTLALGFSVTVLKEFIGTQHARWLWALILGWVGFLVCLLLSLYHSKLTYDTHKCWREIIDGEFSNWKPKAMERALAAYDTIPRIKLVTRLKNWGHVAFIFGICSLSIFVLANYLFVPQQGSVSSKDDVIGHHAFGLPKRNQVINVYIGDRIASSSSVMIDGSSGEVSVAPTTSKSTTGPSH